MKSYFFIILTFVSLSLFAQKEQEDIYTTVDEIPAFPGGEKGLRQYVQKNRQIPFSCKENNTYGQAYIKFIINSDGTVRDITVLKGVPNCTECDNEAKRIISAMPRWKPAMKNGKPVACYWNQIISFEKVK